MGTETSIRCLKQTSPTAKIESAQNLWSSVAVILRAVLRQPSKLKLLSKNSDPFLCSEFTVHVFVGNVLKIAPQFDEKLTAVYPLR